MSDFSAPQFSADMDMKKMINLMAEVMKELDWLINGNLDNKNIKAKSITAEEIKALTITAALIAAGTITADKLTVAQLSAIAADLGTITAGIIYGAYIATSNGTYPRIELNSVGKLLTAFYDATHFASIIPDLAGAPAFRIETATTRGTLAMGGAFTLFSNNEMDILSTDIMFISAPNGVWFDNWSSVYNDSTNQTLQSDLNAKANKGLAGTHIYYVSDTSGGALTRKLTFTDGVLTSQT